MIGFSLGFIARIVGRIGSLISVRVTEDGRRRITEDGRLRIRD